jgi:hypothetical protein
LGNLTEKWRYLQQISIKIMLHVSE